MAYMEDMALEREKSKQAMIAGKQPMFGADTTAAMHALGINLGLVPPGTPPSATMQLLESLVSKGPKGVKVDEAHPLQVPPLTGRLTASMQPAFQSDDSIGNTISGGFSAAKDSALQQMLRDQQRAQNRPAAAPDPQGPAPPPGPGSNRARLGERAPRAAEGATYKADIAFLNERGGHNSVMKDGKIVSVPVDTAGTYKTVDPELAARLRAAGEAYEAANPGKKAQFGEFSRGEDVQQVYYDKYKADGKSIAAPPGRSGHQVGRSGDLPSGGFRDWLNAGNQDKFGLHFPVKGDAPHVEVNPRFKGPAFSAPAAAPANPAALAGASAPSATPGGVPPELSEWVAKKENFTPKAFADYGTTNIGYGTAAKGRTSIDEPTARAEMNAELGRHLATVDALNPNTPPAIRNSLASLGFNTGGSALNNTGLAAAVKAGDWKQAKEIFTQYDKVTDANGVKKPLHGLTIRRGQEAQAFDNPNFYKDPKAGTTAAQDWGGQQHPAASATSATSATPPAAAPATPATSTASAPPPVVADAAKPSATSTPPAAQLGPSGEEPLLSEAESAKVEPSVTQPAAPAPAAVVPAPAAAVAAPVKPPVAPVAPPAAVAPVAKPAPPTPPAVNPAHAVLDTKVIDLVKRGGTPEQVAQIPDFIAGKTLREAMNMPMIGGQVAAGVTPYLGKMGITQQQFDAAVKEGTPKAGAAGKRTEAVPVEPAKVQYAEANTGTMTDAGPERPDDNAPTLDPASQPAVQNADGSISTVRTIGVAENGKEVNIPTVPAEGGRIMSDQEAVQRYVETGKHLGKFDTVEQAGAAAEQLHQNEARQISEQPKGQQGAMTPQLAEALTNAYKDESRVAPEAPPPPDAQPVLPAQPTGPAPGTGGGLSLAPAGLSSLPTGVMPGQAPTQGGGIAMTGMLPPIENATYSTPLLDTAAAGGGVFGSSTLSPIPLQTLNGWGWGGGNIGAGMDWGGGGGGFSGFGGGASSIPMFGTGGW